MAAAEPSPPSGFFGMLSFRRNPTAVASFDPAQDDEVVALDALQSHVADRLAAALQSQPQTRVLSIDFLSKLLDAVSSSDAAFREVLTVSRPPADRLAADLLDRCVKTLDVLNAASLTLASLRGAHRAALTAASCLLARPNANASLPCARARRAIARIFPPSSDPSCNSNSRSSRLPLSMSRNWSAGRHSNNATAATAPPPSQVSSGLGLAIYTMSSLLAFAMWALVAALPCQDRASPAVSMNPPVAPPKQAQWAASMAALQDRIVEEWKRTSERKRNGSSSGSTGTPVGGLLAEMQAVERAARQLDSLLADDEDDQVVRERAEELAAACRALEQGLAPLERQLRAVFHRVVGFRAELMRCIDSNTNAPQHHSF